MSDDSNMIDQATVTPAENTEISPKTLSGTRMITDRMLAGIVLISLAAGFLGGLLGNSAASKSANGSSSGQRQIVNEDSAVINVANSSKPAIVSIVGSKKVAAATAPNDFFNFFFPNATPIPQSQPQETEVSAGSGFFVTADGLIATNKHVVSDNTASYSVYTNDGKKYAATVVAQDPVIDFALVKINGSNFPTLTLGNSDNIKVGQSVVAIGNALGQFTNTVTTGVISGINRNIVATGDTSGSPDQIEGALQTDAAINPGNSGGPLLDLSGQVLGINTAVSQQGQSIGFALPVNAWNKDIDSFRSSKTIVKPYIGVRYIMITPDLKSQNNLSTDQGAYITSGQSNSEPAVVPGSPADKAGLKEKDVITQVNGKDINLDRSLTLALGDLNPNDIVDLTVLRGNQTLHIKVKLGQRT